MVGSVLWPWLWLPCSLCPRGLLEEECRTLEREISTLQVSIALGLSLELLWGADIFLTWGSVTHARVCVHMCISRLCESYIHFSCVHTCVCEILEAQGSG